MTAGWCYSTVCARVLSNILWCTLMQFGLKFNCVVIKPRLFVRASPVRARRMRGGWKQRNKRERESESERESARERGVYRQSTNDCRSASTTPCRVTPPLGRASTIHTLRSASVTPWRACLLLPYVCVPLHVWSAASLACIPLPPPVYV